MLLQSRVYIGRYVTTKQSIHRQICIKGEQVDLGLIYLMLLDVKL